ncbi:MAG: DUF1565 domain-containing protein [Phycisphaerales bacterium]|nr:MAG: DUF1565 domain-containing protein [Phycisphaerales bacterium]
MYLRYGLGLVCSLAVCLPVHAGVIYVDADAQGKKSGKTWSDAYTSLAVAIASASTGDEIWVAEGTYKPIVMKNGLKMYGGFSGTESTRYASDPEAHRTYVSGQGTRQAVKSIYNNSSTVLRGFVIKDGVVSEWDQVGGGLYLENSMAMIVSCVFTNNSARFAGGAVANCLGGKPTFVNCRFASNGGANGNMTPVGGGAVFNHDGSPTFVNCLFSGNKADDGGAVVTLRGVATFINCTFSGNAAIGRRGGALFDNAGRAVVRNSILWENTAAIQRASEIYNSSKATHATDVAHSNVRGGWAGAGNVDSDPLFLDSAKGDYRLQATSPCKDAGSNTFLPQDVGDISADGNTTEILPKDLGLNTRVHGDSVDIGAFEWQLPDG